MDREMMKKWEEKGSAATGKPGFGGTA